MKYLVKIFYKRLIPKYATILMSCGKEAGEWMFNGEPYQLVNNAIGASAYTYNPAKRAQMRQQLGLTSEFTVGHVGRFNPQKNHPFLLDIFAYLVKRLPNAILLLVGGGEDMPKIQAKAQSLGIVDHVRFLGVRSDVADLMQAMDVFVFPSLYEGLPVTMIEAQASGLPCLISDKVPKECILTEGLVEVVSLHTSPEEWAEKALAVRILPRLNWRDVIAACGFDIKTEAVKLQEFYINAYEQNR